MKRIFLLAMLAISQLATSSQIILRGRVLEKSTRNPLAAASITIGHQSTISDEAGSFELRIPSLKNAVVEISHVEYQSVKDSLSIHLATNVQGENDLVFYLAKKDLFLQPVEVMALRSGDNAPFTKTDISKKELEKNNLGQDLPLLLGLTPATVINSDAGNGVGYTGLRIRGSDLSRINVTLNGVPYNDAESQGVFFVDLPDIVSSVSSIQVQRGVGTSSNGAGAFGATINISTNEFNENPYGEVNNSYGSFNTWKHTVKAGSGLINDHFSIDARLSKISSDGYIDRAQSDLHSFYLTGAYYNNSTQVRLNVFGGKEKTYQAWYGVPQSLLKTNRTYNAAGTEKPGEPYENETDNYQQDHYQFFVNHEFNRNLVFNLVLFYTRGKGYYEEYRAAQNFADYGLKSPVIGNDTIASTDLVRQLWLDNNFYGSVFSLQYKQGSSQITLGGGLNKYEGNHFGKVIWSAVGFPKDFEWYRLNALKTDFNLYGKWQHKISDHWESFADLQFRKVNYDLNGFEANPDLKVKNDYHFLNPKWGISFHNHSWRGYISYALANKEPNRDDFEAGMHQQPKPEALHDMEAGIERANSFFRWNAVAYYMRYHDQLVLTGKINDVGAYTRTNIPNSYRLGIELQFTYKPVRQFRWDLNLALSQNKIIDFSEYVDDYDNGGQKINSYKKTDISFSPDQVAGSTIAYLPIQNLELSLQSKYVGAQYLDNTSNKSRKLNAYFLNDLAISWTVRNKLFQEIGLIARLNNLFDIKYEPNGYTFSYIYGGQFTTENYYYPMAGRNFLIGLNVKL